MKHRRITPMDAAALFCAVGFLVTGGLTLRDLLRSTREDAANRELSLQVSQAAEAVPPEEGPYTQEGILRRYEPLSRQNPHMMGWITIPGTKLDCPVMYTPEDPEWYLRRAFDGSDALSGSIFLGEGCAPEGNHLILYGHNMQDGTMFGELPGYAAADYARKHPDITLDTLRQEGTFAVMGAFYCQVDGEDSFPYYRYPFFSSQEEQEGYLTEVLARSLYDTGVRPAWGDRVATLSTCSYVGEAGRFVVVAVEKKSSKEEK